MKSWNHKLLATLILQGLFVLASCSKLVPLSQGGAATCLSLLFLWLVTFFFGFKYGLFCSMFFGLVKLGLNCWTGEYINWYLMAIVLEYPLGYGVFCLGGLLKEPKSDEADSFGKGSKKELFKLRVGCLIGLAGQFVLFVVSAVCFYPPDREEFIDNLLFCMKYDGSYLLVEGILTMLVLYIPPVCEAIMYLKDIVNPGEEDDTLECF